MELESDIERDIKHRFPDAEVRIRRKARIDVMIKKELMVEAARYLRDALNFDHIVSVSVVDYAEKGNFLVAYHIWSTSKKILVTLKTYVPREEPSMSSLIDVFEGVNWHEREANEMFGIRFEGHPDLRRLLLPEDWSEKPPLLKK